jgi:hypothetical protein
LPSYILAIDIGASTKALAAIIDGKAASQSIPLRPIYDPDVPPAQLVSKEISSFFLFIEI